MRRISTKIVCRHFLVALAAVVLPSCADEFRAEVGNNETSYQVGFYAGGVQTILVLIRLIFLVKNIRQR